MEQPRKPSGNRKPWIKDRGQSTGLPGKKKIQVIKKKDDKIRLNRFLSNAGICSRRDADQLITSGSVTVNEEVVTELGSKVSPGDDIRYQGKLLRSEKKVYVLLNKPRGFVTTLEDAHAEKTVMDLVASACTERIYPVGRLDKDTTGLLLLTNDGELTKRLTHPSYQKRKIYHVYLDIPLDPAHLEQIKNGIELEDGFIAADAISAVSEEDPKQAGIEIHSGRNRIVRRIFEHFGYKVVRLDRVVFAGLTKKNLPRGHWRHLTPKEISFLKMS